MVKKTNFKPLALSLCIASASHGADIDLDYIKESDPDLYKKLLVIEDCQKKKVPASECGTKTPAPTALAGDTPHTTPAGKLAEVVPPPAPKGKLEAVVAPPPPPGKWWLASAFTGSAPQKRWDNAVIATLALQKLSGTTEGSQHSGQIEYNSRYNQITNEFSYANSHDDVKQAGAGELDRKVHSLTLASRYDFSEDWFAKVGYNGDKDTGLLMEKTQTYHAGAGLHFVNSSKFTLTGSLSLGRSKESTSPLANEATGLDELEYDVMRFEQDAHWMITDNISLTQSLDVTSSLDEIDEFGVTTGGNCLDSTSNDLQFCVIGQKRNTVLKFSLDLDYKINSYMSIGYSVDIDDDSNPFLIDESRQSTHKFNLMVNFQ